MPYSHVRSSRKQSPSQDSEPFSEPEYAGTAGEQPEPEPAPEPEPEPEPESEYDMDAAYTIPPGVSAGDLTEDDIPDVGAPVPGSPESEALEYLFDMLEEAYAYEVERAVDSSPGEALERLLSHTLFPTRLPPFYEVYGLQTYEVITAVRGDIFNQAKTVLHWTKLDNVVPLPTVMWRCARLSEFARSPRRRLFYGAMFWYVHSYLVQAPERYDECWPAYGYAGEPALWREDNSAEF